MPKTMIGRLSGLRAARVTVLVDFIVFYLPDRTRRVACDDGERRNVSGDHGTSANDGSFADGYAGKHDAVEANPDVATDADGFGGSATGHSAVPLEGKRLKLLTPLGGVEGDAITVHENDIPGNEGVVADVDLRITNEPCAVNE